MNAVGADQNIAAHGPGMRAGAIEEIGGNATLILGEGAQPAAGMNGIAAEPRLDRVWITPCSRPRWIENCGTS